MSQTLPSFQIRLTSEGNKDRSQKATSSIFPLNTFVTSVAVKYVEEWIAPIVQSEAETLLPNVAGV